MILEVFSNLNDSMIPLSSGDLAEKHITKTLSSISEVFKSQFY